MSGAINARPTVLVDYAPDPHGAQLFAAITNQVAADLNTSRPVIGRWAESLGWHRQQQQARGAVADIARMQAGVAPVSPRNSELSREVTLQATGTAAIFQERMARGLR